MEYFLLHLSYSSTGWDAIIDAGATFDDRLGPVRKLIANLGGSFASFHFYDTPSFKDEARRHVVLDKFAMFGSHDLMAVVAMPDKRSAQALSMALSSQSGIQRVEMTSMMPFDEAITTAAATSKTAIAATRYKGPGKTRAK